MNENERPMISFENDIPPQHQRKDSNRGCSGCLTNLLVLVLIITVLFYACGDDSAAETPAQQPNRSAVNTQPVNPEPRREPEYEPVPEQQLPSAQEPQQPVQQQPTGQLSDAAYDFEQMYFHGAYTQLGPVEIHHFDERADLMERAMFFLSDEASLNSEVSLTREHKLLGSDSWCVSSEASNYRYIGETRGGKPHGFGMILYESQGKYNSSLQGTPLFYYIGNFKDGTYNGYGALFFAEDADISQPVQKTRELGLLDDEAGEMLVMYLFNHVKYEGYFEGNELNGKANYFHFPLDGERIFIIPELNQPIPDYVFGITYPDVTMGEYKNGELNGYAKKYLSNHLIYEGEMKGEQFDGQGTFYNNDGSVYYSGEWKNSVPANQ